jgi:NADH dehydrogenase [ubiquinone] 1 alpha subcomplex assembly factor 7
MNALAELLKRRIALRGPLTVADYMSEALTHPEHGYYARRDPLGLSGDFVTAPEISQMFGELIGLWCAVVWRSMGRPSPILLVEFGPGRGTLLGDALRATRDVPGFPEALALHLVETNRALRERQAESLDSANLSWDPAWHDGVADLPEGPSLIIANEFFDALPIRQFQRSSEGWRERLVDLTEDGTGFRLVLSPVTSLSPLVPDALHDAPVGSVVEVSPAGLSLAHHIGERVARLGGAALIVDYGPARTTSGDTLQAVRDHRYHDVLVDPGDADLTAYVDFQSLARAGEEGGAATFGPVPQGDFLERLGLGVRAESLLASADSRQAREIRAAHRRLADPAQMGALFKALALQNRELPVPPGFD